MRRAESAARGFAVHDAANFINEFQEVKDRIAPAFAALKEQLHDNPEQLKRIDSAEEIARQRLAISSEMIEKKKIGDIDGINTMFANAGNRALMRQLDDQFDSMIATEEHLLDVRTATSRRTGTVLISIDLAGASLILLLVVVLMREGRQLQTSLHASEAAKHSLEAAVAERTEHLLAAHEEMRLSASVLENTLHSMAEAVLVIDPKGEIVLSNPAAEKMLHYKPGMNVRNLRAMSNVFHADGSTPMQLEEIPGAPGAARRRVRRAGDRDSPRARR